MTEKRYKRLVSSIDYYYCIDTNDDKGLTEEDMLNQLNEQDKTIKELKQDNDIKFWKLQCMHYFNANSLFMSEISRAIKKGYEVSEQFQKYLDDLKEHSKKIKEKNKRLFGDSE